MVREGPPIDIDDPLGQKALVQIHNRGSPLDPMTSSEHALQALGDRLWTVVFQHDAPLDARKTLAYIADVR